MLKKAIIFLSSVLFMTGCENEWFKDPNYPTTYHKIDSDLLSEMISGLYQENEYLRTSLNEFGFCAFTHYDGDRYSNSPPIIDALTESEAKEIVVDFISKNKAITGINNANDISFSRSHLDTGYASGATSWIFTIADQRINTIEILNSTIIIKVLNGELSYFNGNWYPRVYIPKSFNFSSDEAKSILENKVVEHFGWGGPFEAVVTQESLDKSSVGLVVYPKKAENKIELFITWTVDIPSPVFYIFYVDVMTGNIISSRPTIYF